MMAYRQAAAFWAAVLGLSVLALWLLRSILLPFVLGMAIGFLLDPPVARLERRGLPRGVAAGVLVLGAYVAGTVLAVLLAPVVLQQLAEIATRLPVAVAAVSDLLQPVLAGPLAAVAERAAALAGDLLGRLLGQGWALLTFLMLLAVTPLVAFYLLRDWPRIIARIDEALPRAHAETIRAQAREMERVLAGFARGQTILCGALALFYAAALSAIGLEFGVLLGLVAGLASFVPYLGTAVGLVASVGVATLQFWPGWGRPLIALGVFLFGQVVADYVLGPRLLGERIGVHPLWVLFGVFAGGALFGVVGTVVAVPLCAVIGVLARFGMERYRASALYSGAVGLGPPTGGEPG